jgi:ATP-binding cassette, subfamily B (MDR/TAP), member 1
MGGGDTGEKKEENNGTEKEREKGSSGDEGKVPILKMFKFSDSHDVALMVVGTAAALANGISQPMMTFIFGQMIDAFGGGTSADILDRVNSVCCFNFHLFVSKFRNLHHAFFNFKI